MKTKSVTERLPEGIYMELIEVAERTDTNQSQIIIDAVDCYLKEDKHIDKKVIINNLVEMANEINVLEQRYPEYNFENLKVKGAKICQLLSI